MPNGGSGIEKSIEKRYEREAGRDMHFGEKIILKSRNSGVITNYLKGELDNATKNLYFNQFTLAR